MMRKFLSCILAFAMVFSLAGCGGPKEPTAEELMKGVREIDPAKYNDIGLSMTVTSDGGDVNEIGVDAGVEMAGDVMHLYDMKVNASLEGLSMTVRMEAWMDRSADKAYMSMSMLGQDTGWEETDLDADEPVSGLTDLKDRLDELSKGTDPKLDGHKPGDDYVVRWTVDGKAIGEVLDSMGDGYGDVKAGTAEAWAVFGGETRELVSMNVSCPMTVDGSDGSVDLAVTFRTVNGSKTLSVPQDVVSAAAAGSSFGDGPVSFGDGGPDDSFGGTAGDGTFGQDGPDEEPAEAPGVTGGRPAAGDRDNLDNSDGGHDAVIDAAAEYLADYDPKGNVYVHHYDRYSTLAWYPPTDEWGGSINVTHYTDTEYGDAMSDYEAHVKFLSEYYGMAPTAGGAGEENAVFIRHTDTSMNLDFCGYSGSEVYMEAATYCYEHTEDEDAVEHLLFMLDVLGGCGV